MENLALYVLIAMLVIIFILNIVATYIVFNTHFEVKQRRMYQTILIWLLPVIGSSLAIYINREGYFYQKYQKQVGNHTSISASQAIDHALGASHHGGK